MLINKLFMIVTNLKNKYSKSLYMKKLFFLFLILYTHSINSETILLKTGQTLKIKLVSQNADTVTYSQGGKETILEKNKIRKIIYARTPELEDLQVKEEIKKFNQDKLKKIKKSKEEEEEDARLLEEEFNKAMEEQERQERLNMSFEERITKLENDILKTRTQMANMDPSSYSGAKLRKMESDIEDLKNRVKKVEKFLEIDPEIENYYNSPRSMWQVVWRSAIFPGWGLNYARGNFGTTYSSLFFFTAIGSIGYKEYLKDDERKIRSSAISELVVTPTAFSSLLASSNLASTNPNLNTDLQAYQSYNLTLKGSAIAERYDSNYEGKQRSDRMMRAAVAIYLIQLIHSGIYGYFWEKNPPKQFLKDEEKNEESELGSWNFQIFPSFTNQPTIGASNKTNLWNMEFGYSFSY